MWVWLSPLCRLVQEYSYKIYFVFFRYSYKFLRILKVCTIFWELNQLKNDWISRTVPCWIRPMASTFQAWRPTERGAPACWRGSAHAVPGRVRDARSAMVTAQWPRTRRHFGATGAIGAEVQVRQGPRVAVDCEAGWRISATMRGGSSPEGGLAPMLASSWSCMGGQRGEGGPK
jgi:hypothetical protein